MGEKQVSRSDAVCFSFIYYTQTEVLLPLKWGKMKMGPLVHKASMKHLHPCRTLHQQLHLACSQLLESVEAYFSMWAVLSACVNLPVCMGVHSYRHCAAISKEKPKWWMFFTFKGFRLPRIELSPFHYSPQCYLRVWWHFLPHANALAINTVLTLPLWL